MKKIFDPSAEKLSFVCLLIYSVIRLLIYLFVGLVVYLFVRFVLFNLLLHSLFPPPPKPTPQRPQN